MSKPRIVHGRLGDVTAIATRSRHAGAWDEATCSQYVSDVRVRAEEAAKNILAQAMAEAEAIRRSAHAEGLAQGRAESQAMAETECRHLAETVANLQRELKRHAQETQARYDALSRRLLVAAVEKATGVILEDQRRDLLWRLFVEARDRLRAASELVVWVHPDDVQMMSSLLEQSGVAAELSARVRPDAAMTRGGVRLESSDAVVDNTVDERLRQVLEVLEKLVHDS